LKTDLRHHRPHLQKREPFLPYLSPVGSKGVD
jgi:hypothetical protein